MPISLGAAVSSLSALLSWMIRFPLLRAQPEICVPAKVLLEKIDPAGIEGLTPNSLSHQIRKNVEVLRNSGIIVSFRRSNGGRLICLKSVDGVDDLAAEKIVTIDPADQLAGGYAEGAR